MVRPRPLTPYIVFADPQLILSERPAMSAGCPFARLPNKPIPAELVLAPSFGRLERPDCGADLDAGTPSVLAGISNLTSLLCDADQVREGEERREGLIFLPTRVRSPAPPFPLPHPCTSLPSSSPSMKLSSAFLAASVLCSAPRALAWSLTWQRCTSALNPPPPSPFSQ